MKKKNKHAVAVHITDIKQAKQIITAMYLDELLNKKMINKYKNRAITGSIIMALIGMYMSFATGKWITMTVVLVPIFVWCLSSYMEIKTYKKKKQSVIDGTYFDNYDNEFILNVANRLYDRHPDFSFKKEKK